MRLKRLEMVGFKSFADKTRVEFEPGITAVVGPNGCGKSNIADAVRWSLGEMSARSLRSQQMMDVIFNGTANRSPQGMSEVALTFDNTSGQIPLDYTEVTIARRLFRSGESEYYINKTQCRLKDIRDLFLDTGVGNDGYYVMAQGKIEFILSAKPEERRELFEEAAGVSKYKARREEAIRRLNKVEQDMLRLNDSLAIYKQQMDNLDAAVRKARQHQKLQEELHTLEIAVLLQQFKAADSQWQTMHAQHEQETERLVELRKQVADEEAHVAQEREQAESFEVQVMELQRQVSQCESDWAKTDAECRGAQERTVEITAAQERLKEERTGLLSTLDTLRQSLNALSSEITELQAQYHAKNDRYKDEHQKSEADQLACHHQQKEYEQTKARLLELVRLISHHRNETVRLTSLTIRNEEVSKSKQRELEKIQMRRSAMDEQVQSQEQLANATQARLVELDEALRSMDELQKSDAQQLAETEQTIHSSREQIARLEAEKSTLEKWLQQDPVAMASQAIRQKGLPGIYGPVGNLFRTSDPYERLLSRALGDRTHYFIAETLNDAQAAISFLSEERKGWATFLVLDRLTESDSQVTINDTLGSRSLSAVIECEDRFRPALHFLLGKTFYVGATLFEEGVLRGGADPSQDGYRATPADLDRLLGELTSLQSVLRSAQETKDSLKNSVAQREATRAPLQAEHGKAQVVCQVQNETLGRLRDDRQMAETEERLLTQEREDSLKAIDQTHNALKQEEALLATLETEEKSLQLSVQSQDSKLQALRQAIQAHQSIVSQLRLEAETTRERLLGKEREQENATREIKSLDNRAAQIDQQQTDNQNRLAQLAALQEEKATLLKTLQETKDTQQAALNVLLTQRQDVQNDLHRLEEELTEKRENLSQAQARVTEVEFQSRSFQQEKERLELSLKDTYQLSVEEAQSHYGELSPNPEEIVRLKRRLESLGAVNLAAPEEHAQLEERYHFLLTQQQDLLKAKDDLHQAIQKINATTREQFKVTFDLVRQNFQNLYKTLFQGGEADVVLTDEHNLMETGVEILAQPPGKKLQNIALLSGGEKALTAIALLFAFFMVKPSPFCLLDEVDAPLDEANVKRFLGMVKTFSEKTQFIMITHNKRSMETADVLYGVTMAELGVSSIISVKMQATKPTEAAVA